MRSCAQHCSRCQASVSSQTAKKWTPGFVLPACPQETKKYFKKQFLIDANWSYFLKNCDMKLGSGSCDQVPNYYEGWVYAKYVSSLWIKAVLFWLMGISFCLISGCVHTCVCKHVRQNGVMLKNSVWQPSDSQKLKCFAIPGIGQVLRKSTAPRADGV